jgi:hypothetical protein
MFHSSGEGTGDVDIEDVWYDVPGFSSPGEEEDNSMTNLGIDNSMFYCRIFNIDIESHTFMIKLH